MTFHDGLYCVQSRSWPSLCAVRWVSAVSWGTTATWRLAGAVSTSSPGTKSPSAVRKSSSYLEAYSLSRLLCRPKISLLICCEAFFCSFVHLYQCWVRSQAPSIQSHRGAKVVWPVFQPMRVPEEPVCIELFRQNPVFTSLHLKSGQVLAIEFCQAGKKCAQ